MDLAGIVAELKQQRESLSQAIVALESSASSIAPRTAGSPKKTRVRRLTAEGRARLSELMKKRWAEAKRKKKNRP